nr:CoA-binding protein [Anaerolineae bacterium]
ILGQTVYRNLMDIPDQVDLVQLFRPSAEVMPHVEMAIEREVPFLWMQTGIVNEEAAALARKAGMQVVMDRCMMIEHRRFRSRL